MKLDRGVLLRLGFLVSAIFFSISLIGCNGNDDPTIEIDEGKYVTYTANQFLKKFPNYRIKVDDKLYSKRISNAELMELANKYKRGTHTVVLMDVSSNEHKELGTARMYDYDYYSLVDFSIVVKFTKKSDAPLYFYIYKENLLTTPQTSGDTENYVKLTINQFLEKYPGYCIVIDHRHFSGRMSDYNKQVIYNDVITKGSILMGLHIHDNPGDIKDFIRLDNYNNQYEIGNTGILVKCIKNENEPFYFHVPINFSEISKEDLTIQ